MSVAVIVLAAGSSRRLGVPKQALPFCGETLLQRSLRVARTAAVGPVYVVVNCQPEAAEAMSATGCIVTVNEQADEGIGSSIGSGVRAALSGDDVEGFVLMTCDQVGLRPSHLRALCDDADHVCASGYAGKVGIPAYFPHRYAKQLLELKGDTGARHLLQAARCIPAEELAFDVDTPEDIAQLRRKEERYL